MEPNLQNVVLGVLSNGLTTLIAHLGRKGGKLLVGKELYQRIKREETALYPILKRATEAVAEGIEWNGPPRMEEICLFLSSPEVEAIVRQMYSAKLVREREQNSLELIRREFLTSFSLYVGLEEEKLASLSQHLLDTLIEGCEQVLHMAIDDGILSAHEAKSASRHRMILGELAAIQKNLVLLTAQKISNHKAILEFEKKYRKQVEFRHGHIIPPHFDAARKLPIDALYVKPSFLTTPKKKGEESQLLNTRDFLSVIYRAVLLGNPGGGKSTFASKLCYDLAIRYEERLCGGREITPILVVLRDYGSEKKARNYSIIQFIEATANSKYQVQPPPEAFEYLLLNGRVMVIFDGLDELLDTSYRQEISSDVESFCALYPSAPALVTSREVGYEQAPLDENRFEIFHLAPFDDNQVREYVKKWFNSDADLTPEQQKQKTDTFLEESQIVSDLRSNPLMLALMCNIYRGENYIPRNRPDVYEKCAIMLFERWDKSRGIYASLPFEAHINPAMKYLAYWIYADEKLQGGVTEENLVAKATEYLCPRRFEDRDEAEKAAREFIQFCRGRAWVFTDTGTTKEGKSLFQFTHRTFLEYFTAAHLVRTYPTPGKLIEILLPKIIKREWDVVAQLAFQLQNRNVEGAGDELLRTVIKQAHKTKNMEALNLLSFATRCLEFMVPSPKVTRDVTANCIKSCLTRAIKQTKKDIGSDGPARYHGDPGELLNYLLYATSENRTTIADSIEKMIVKRITCNIEPILPAIEIGLNLSLPLYSARMMRVPLSEVSHFWENTSDRIFDTLSGQMETLSSKYLLFCFDSVYRRRLPITDLVRLHGVESLFSGHAYIVFPHTFRMSLADIFINDLFSTPYLTEKQKYHENILYNLKDIGTILFTFPTPWILPDRVDHELGTVFGEERFQDKNLKQQLHLDSDILFGAFTLLAVMLEFGTKQLHEHLKKSQIHLFNSIRWILLARFEQVDKEELQKEMDKCGFSHEQQSFVWHWIRKEIHLVAPHPRKGKKR
jgi:hypothetical protein